VGLKATAASSWIFVLLFHKPTLEAKIKSDFYHQ